MHQLTLIDDEINKAYKLKELYRDFDNISKDEINNYNMEKELKLNHRNNSDTLN